VISSSISVKVLTVDNLIASYATPFVLDAPTISNFTPNSGKSQSTITITGTNFNPVPSNQTIKIGGKQIPILTATGTELTVQLPRSMNDTTTQVRIDVAGQTSLSTGTFHVLSPWKRVTSFPSNPRANTASFSIGNLGYVGLGTKLNFTSHADFYQ